MWKNENTNWKINKKDMFHTVQQETDINLIHQNNNKQQYLPIYIYIMNEYAIKEVIDWLIVQFTLPFKRLELVWVFNILEGRL